MEGEPDVTIAAFGMLLIVLLLITLIYACSLVIASRTAPSYTPTPTLREF
jgi:hypothetical protein